MPFETIAAYDRPFFPEKRTGFIKSWINQTSSLALGVLNNGQLAGYGIIRQCRSGHKIGPLFADTPELAELLFQSLKSRINSQEPIFLDTPEVNPQAIDLAERNGMKVVFETARMYTGEKPELPFTRLFGVTSFELG